MKRRKFLQVSSMLTLGTLATQPLLAQTETADCLTPFSGHNYGSSDKQGEYKIVIKICIDSINFFEKAGEAEKIMELIIYKIGTSIDDLSYVFDAEYKITASKNRENDSGLYDVSAVQTKILKEGSPIPSNINLKNLDFLFRYNNQSPLYIISIVDKKDYTFIELTKDTDDDCFLTTACVKALHKADNCEELMILRQFRDTHLLHSEMGKNLVKEYYTIAPNIVKNINKQSNSLPVYTQIYSKMIQPTLQHIEQKEFEKAIELYKNYTYALKTEYFKEN